MKYLNLSKGFNPYNVMHWSLINFDSFIFPGGEPHIKIKSFFYTKQDIVITTRINCSDDFILLLLATDAIYQSGWAGDVHLFIPYFPGARQDRRMVDGEPLTVGIYTGAINERAYETVNIFDPHSDVTSALLDNCIVHSNHKFVRAALNTICRIDGSSYDDINMWGKDVHLISPDAGANKKMYALSHSLGANHIIKCDKHRDLLTGKISDFEVYVDDLGNRDCVIIDDICDGGGTFIGLAKELKKKNAGKLYLIVSHGIFSKGFEELEKHFECIYYTDSINDMESKYSNYFINQDKLKQIKLKNCI